MTNKWKIILSAGLAVFALACIIGGPKLAESVNAANVEALKAQQSQTVEETAAPKESQNAAESPKRDYSYIVDAAKKQDDTPDAVPSEAADNSVGETITVEEDGTVTIAPDFEAQANNATNTITPGGQAETNMGGGGGEMDLGEDGVYHGSQSGGSTPASTPAPAITPESTPAPVTSTAPQTGGDSESSGPPSYNGSYGGERSPDGQYVWMGTMGWVKPGHDDGGISGDYSDVVTGGLTGNKVGNM